jgi:hypothetical protein
MKLRPVIACLLAISCANKLYGKGDMPPHTDQNSRAPQGPNAYALSFAVNGADTTTVVISAIQTGDPTFRTRE